MSANLSRKAVARPDAWLYPDETLAQGGGDCEDLAFLLAALLMASGISGYCVRVALGALHIVLPDGKRQKYDQCWVMYLNEPGVWPHRDEIAVDDQAIGKRHKLYRTTASGPADRQAYASHFRWRVNTAVQRVRKALQDNYHP